MSDYRRRSSSKPAAPVPNWGEVSNDELVELVRSDFTRYNSTVQGTILDELRKREISEEVDLAFLERRREATQAFEAREASRVAASGGRGAYRSTYKTARGVAELISAIGWVAVAAAGLMVLVVTERGAGFAFVAIVPALGIALGGFLLVSMGQLTRAAVDTADHTGAILSVLAKREEATRLPLAGSTRGESTEVSEQEQ